LKSVTLKEIEYTSLTLAQKLMAYSEPIPDFSTRFPNILESCIATPFMRFSGKYLYPSLLSKASILFYLMIKNHPFSNGNKRIAVTTLLFFLYKNNKWMEVEPYELYQFTMWIASSPSELKDSVLISIQEFIKNHIVST